MKKLVEVKDNYTLLSELCLTCIGQAKNNVKGQKVGKGKKERSISLKMASGKRMQ